MTRRTRKSISPRRGPSALDANTRGGARDTYVHGYGAREEGRLADQASILAELLHTGTHYERGDRVLEVGCGVGAQTRILTTRSPLAHFTCVDACEASIETARRNVAAIGMDNARFEVGDLYRLPHSEGSFDHVFVCFVLEHLERPLEALRGLRRLLVPGGTITVIEGDHGSAVYHPKSEHAQHTIECLIEAQRRGGNGDARVGRRLYPLLQDAGFGRVCVMPRIAYADGGRPEWVDGFTRRTFLAMVQGARERCIRLGLTTPERWARGIRDLERTAETDGTFTYLFYKAAAARMDDHGCTGHHP
jgi:SAM-dependent methyltransferase